MCVECTNGAQIVQIDNWTVIQAPDPCLTSLTVPVATSTAVNLSYDLFDKNELTVKDNTEEEILDITYEMHLLANNISYYSKEDHILQERFKNIYPKDDFWQNYKMHGKIMANYSINYLRKNKFWLE